MPNGKKMIEEVRSLVADDTIKVPSKACNRMILTALVELYDKVEQLQPVLQTNRVFMWIISVIVVAFVGAMISGKLALVWR